MDMLRLVATDGYRLATAEIMFEHGFDGDFIVDNISVTTITTLLENSERLTFYLREPGKLSVINETGRVLNLVTLGGKYPDWRAAVKEHHAAASNAYNADFLSDALVELWNLGLAAQDADAPVVTVDPPVFRYANPPKDLFEAYVLVMPIVPPATVTYALPGRPAPIAGYPPATLRCSVCHLPQMNTPSGPVCPQGHGGATAVDYDAEIPF